MGTPNPKEKDFILTNENEQDVRKIANKNLNALRNDPDAPYLFAYNGLLLELVMYQQYNKPFDVEKALKYARMSKHESTIYYLFALSELNQKPKPLESLGRDILQKIVRDDPEVYNSMSRTNKTIKGYIDPLRSEVITYAKLFEVKINGSFTEEINDPSIMGLNLHEYDIIKHLKKEEDEDEYDTIGYYVVYKGELHLVKSYYSDEYVGMPFTLSEAPHIHYWDEIFKETITFNVSKDEFNIINPKSFKEIGKVKIGRKLAPILQDLIKINGKTYKVITYDSDLKYLSNIDHGDASWILDKRKEMAPFIDKDTIFFGVN